MKIFLSLALFLLSCINFFSQNIDDAVKIKNNNSVSIQLFGNTETLFSLNYERVYFSTKNEIVDLSVRTGFGYHKNSYDNSNRYSFVAELNCIIGKKIHFADIGLGYVPNFSTSDLTSTNIPESERGNFFHIYDIRLGYRIYLLENKAFIRVSEILTYRPITPKSSKFTFREGFGFSLGLIF